MRQSSGQHHALCQNLQWLRHDHIYVHNIFHIKYIVNHNLLYISIVHFYDIYFDIVNDNKHIHHYHVHEAQMLQQDEHISIGSVPRVVGFGLVRFFHNTMW